MKAKYENAELEVIELEACDIVTSSGDPVVDEDNDGIFGGGYDAGGWT